MPDLSPTDEACQALVDRINEGTDYILEAVAEYSRVQIDTLESIDRLRVDITAGTSKQPALTLDNSDNSSHALKVWVRSQLPPQPEDTIVDLSLLTRQLFDRLNLWTSDSGRVQVWDCNVDDQEEPLKKLLIEAQLYVATISLRVEVMR